MVYKEYMYRIILVYLVVFFTGCNNILDNKIDPDYIPGQVFINYVRTKRFGMGVYRFIPSWYSTVDGVLLAAATDDAGTNYISSNIKMFNRGSWSKYSNPDDQWQHYYEGIRRANVFLLKSAGYKDNFANDTLTSSGKREYEDQIDDMFWLRNEVRFLRAFFYFELAKRYGGVPIVKDSDVSKELIRIPRSSFDSVINYIVDECNIVVDSVRSDWIGYRSEEAGRVTKGAVLALKARALLFAASPLFNPGNDISKWEKSAKASADIIDLHKYKLERNYRNLFIAPLSYRSDEMIFSRRRGKQNFMEVNNYPVGTDGGKGRLNPSQNLVSAYEKLPGWSSTYPYRNRDPRLQQTIVVNNSEWNGRHIETYIGGADGKGIKDATKTGYYLKKFLTENVDIIHGGVSNYTWIIFRYGEVLLNFAESMNEAYGPDLDPKGYGMTAREALNKIRARESVKMPPITFAIASSKEDLRKSIRHERRIELAFEGHRFWDVRRWKIADSVLNAPLLGVDIDKIYFGRYDHTIKEVENRFFDRKMYLYPIPQNEIDKSNGKMEQNAGW